MGRVGHITKWSALAALACPDRSGATLFEGNAAKKAEHHQETRSRLQRRGVAEFLITPSRLILARLKYIGQKGCRTAEHIEAHISPPHGDEALTPRIRSGTFADAATEGGGG